jgi:hypothetical protein
VAAGAFHGTLDRGLRTDELENFCQQMARLYDCLTGEAILDTMEHWLRIRVAGDERGHLEASCRLCDDLAGRMRDQPPRPCRGYIDIPRLCVQWVVLTVLCGTWLYLAKGK